MADPLLAPASNRMTACSGPEIAVRLVGASGAVLGIEMETGLEAALWPAAFTAINEF